VTQLTVLDLFAGCGGLSLGLTWAGWNVLAAVERSAMAGETYFRNFLGSAADWQEHRTRSVRESFSAGLLVDDIAVLPTVLDQVVDRVGKAGLDLLAGGPPCQGFSLAGLRSGDDPRNKLVWSFLDVAKALQPRAVLMENVPAIHQPFERGSRGSTLADLATALKTLPGEGYVTCILLLSASDFGVPQKRQRAFLVGIRADVATDAQMMRPLELGGTVVDEAHALYPMRNNVHYTTADALWDIQDGAYASLADCPPTVDPQYARWSRSDLTPQGEAPASVPNHKFRAHHPNVKTRFGFLRLLREHGLSDKALYDLRVSDRDWLTAELQPIAEKLPVRIADEEVRIPSQLYDLAYQVSSKKHSQRVLDPMQPSPTVMTLPDDFVHYGEDRTLTIREMARLQSFPDSFIFYGNETTGGVRRREDVPQYSQVGNAVPPRLGAALGAQLRRLLVGVPAKAASARLDRAVATRGRARPTLAGGEVENGKRVVQFSAVGEQREGQILEIRVVSDIGHLATAEHTLQDAGDIHVDGSDSNVGSSLQGDHAADVLAHSGQPGEFLD
jgi:DNA (cytosine-5)-methyltransferase 1